MEGQKCTKRPRQEMEKEMEDEDELTMDEKINYIIKIMEERNKTEGSTTRKSIQETVQKEISKLKDEIKSVILQEVARGIKQFVEEIKQLKLSVEILKQKDETSQQNKQDCSKIEKGNINMDTYAEKAKKCRTQEIIVTPVVQQTSEQTMEQIKDKVDILTLGVGVGKVTNGQKGKIIISCNKNQDTETLSSVLKEKIGPDYKVNVIRKKLLKLKIVGIKENLDLNRENEKEFLMKVAEQNELITNDKIFMMKILKKNINNREIGTIILETDSKTHNTLIERERIKIGWGICRVYDYVSVLQCYKCWGYNHFAKDCRNKIVCRKCAGEHSEVNCASENKKCQNCADVITKFKVEGWSSDHEVTDRNCEVYKQNIARVLRNTQYCNG